jgi:hypothetical protein
LILDSSVQGNQMVCRVGTLDHSLGCCLRRWQIDVEIGSTHCNHDRQLRISLLPAQDGSMRVPGVESDEQVAARKWAPLGVADPVDDHLAAQFTKN